MALIDQPTIVPGGMIERIYLDHNGGMTLEYSKLIEGHKYAFHCPIKETWLKYDDVINLVRGMAKGYFDLLTSL